jgi:hypothetical protein
MPAFAGMTHFGTAPPPCLLRSGNEAEYVPGNVRISAVTFPDMKGR